MLVITAQQDKPHPSRPLMFVQQEAIVKSDQVKIRLADQDIIIHLQE